MQHNQDVGQMAKYSRIPLNWRQATRLCVVDTEWILFWFDLSWNGYRGKLLKFHWIDGSVHVQIELELIEF